MTIRGEKVSSAPNNEIPQFINENAHFACNKKKKSDFPDSTEKNAINAAKYV